MRIAGSTRETHNLYLMENVDTQSKILAQAIYEIRVLLSGYLGSQNSGDPCARRAAHLAYALHNEALSVIENRTFDSKQAIRKIEAVDKMFDEDFSSRFADHLK